MPRRAAEFIAAQFDTVAAAAEGCDALVATGMSPAASRASVAEKLGIRYVYASFCRSSCRRRTTGRCRSGPAVPAGRDRQPGAVGPGRPEL